MTELDNIKDRYARRERTKAPMNKAERLFDEHIRKERELVMKEFLDANFNVQTGALALEIGAGSGGNLPFLQQLGFNNDQLFANELLKERMDSLQANFPNIQILPGDALKIEGSEKFHIILQSTVFSSILDADFRKQLAKHLLHLLHPKGMILWYDFVYNNPGNPDVRKVSRAEVKALFPDCSIEFKRVTLAPPIGRKIGGFYSIINTLFPFLRTHIVAFIRKKPAH